MKWPHVALALIAPPAAAKLNFPKNAEVWHLNLDQIESNTGQILNQVLAPAGEAGNSTYAFDTGNVLYSKLRPYLNKVVCPAEPGIATSELVPLRPKQAILDRRYLAYYLRSHDFVAFASAAVAGAKMPRMIMAKFWKRAIALPPISEQRQIVAILDQAEALRKTRIEADVQASRILSVLFNQMFGDPATNPKGWPKMTLGQLTSERPQYGANAPSVEIRDGAPRYIRITDIDDDGILRDDDIRSLEVADWKPYQLSDGDLLFARSGATVGKTYLYQPEDGQCAFAGYLIRFILDKNLMEPWVAFSFTQTSYYKSWVMGKQRAAAQPNINAQEYASLELPVPPSQMQRQFARMAQSIRQMHRKRISAKIALHNLMISISHRAFIGDLTAKWREAHMKELLREMEMQAKALATS